MYDTKKDYMLRVRLSKFQKARLELILTYLEAITNEKFTKAGIMGYLLDHEFERLQLDIVSTSSMGKEVNNVINKEEKR